MEKKGTGVIIARFQTDALTQAHIELIRTAFVRNERCVVLLGESPTRFTNNNPLSYDIRQAMLTEEYGKLFTADLIHVRRLPDNRCDKFWSKTVDAILSEWDDPIIYHGRDSFKASYSGKYPTFDIGERVGVSSTLVRKTIAETRGSDMSSDFRAGIIYATQNKFPTAYPTVDIALIQSTMNRILLGQKPNEDVWRLPGGFVDVTDQSLEDAAKRELSEEVKGVEIHYLKYVASMKIDDWRYKGSSDGIMTSLFEAEYYYGAAEAGDDLQRVMWFDYRDAIEIIAPLHKPLLLKILENKKF